MDFCVVVRRHEAPEVASIYRTSEGPHRWCVYVYVYPTHPIFPRFRGEKTSQPALDGMPLHAGCTYLQRHYRAGKITSIEVGCDYNHYGDEHFGIYATPDQAGEVFRDAEALFAWMNQRGPESKEVLP